MEKLNYFQLFLSSFRIEKLKNQKLKTATTVHFFFINLLLGVVLRTILSELATPRNNVVFLGLNQVFLVFPAVVFFLIFGTIILHFLAVILKGKGTITQTLSAVCLSSGPLVFLGFFNIPVIAFLLTGVFLYLLVNNLLYIHQYGILYASFNVMVPVGILSMILFQLS